MRGRRDCAALLMSRTKGRETIGHSSCAGSSFPTERKHGHKALSKDSTHINIHSELKIVMAQMWNILFYFPSHPHRVYQKGPINTTQTQRWL